ncbi:hypothetical protein D3C73_1427690 [compost metagenome]
MSSVSARDPGEQVDRAAQTVRLHDFGDPREFIDDAGQFGLPDADAHERLQREAQHVRREGPLVGEEHPGLLQSRHARLDGVA